MDVGLHVGLAAWIHGQGEARGFAVWPALPIPMAVGDLEIATTMHDVVRAWEFAQLANREVRDGSRLGAAGSPLWTRHHRLLTEMEFAARAWDEAEQGELDAALAVLFVPGPFPTPTAGYLLYQEYRQAYRDLELTGASEADLAAVLALWVTSGRKPQVEAAQGTISRLMQRSSHPLAEAERVMLHPDLLLATPTGSYAPTTMTPLSATDERTWLRGEATVDELDQAVGDAAARPQWVAWRANRHGTIRFRFIALSLHRSWFTPALYERRDWRLAEGEIASAGDGVGGPVPAFADRMYLARVESMQLSGSSGGRPAKPGKRPTHTIPIRLETAWAQLQVAKPAPSKALRAAPVRASARAGVVRTKRASVRAKRPATRVSAGPTVIPRTAMRRVARGYLGHVQLSQLHARFVLAEQLVTHEAARPVRPVASPTFVVGLGCRAVPASPTPNDTYQWAA